MPVKLTSMLKQITNTRRARLNCLLIPCLFGSVPTLTSQPKSCSQQTINRLEVEADTIRAWPKLCSFYQRYRKCHVDDAEVSTGVSESVARLLTDHWQTLHTASSLFKRDDAFEAFALAVINITDSTEELDRIDKLATERCPRDLHPLCRKIRRAIRDNN